MQTTAGTAAVNGATIAYDVTGSGPPVFLISGGGTLDRRMWDEQVPVLSRRHTVVDAIVSNPMVLSAANAHVRERVKRIYLDNAAVFASDFALVRLWRPTSPPAVKRLASIRVPALVVVGDQDSDHVRATADELAGRIDGAQLVVLRGGGHLLNLDVPGEFNNAISTFLAKPR